MPKYKELKYIKVFEIDSIEIRFSPTNHMFSYYIRNISNKCTTPQFNVYQDCLDAVNVSINDEKLMKPIKVYYDTYSTLILAEIVKIGKDKDYVKIKYEEKGQTRREWVNKNKLFRKTKLSTTKVNKILTIENQIKQLKQEANKIKGQLYRYKMECL